MIQTYIGPGLDKNKCEQQAIDRSKDRRSPDVSILHYHPHSSPCKLTETHKAAILGKLYDITEK